MAERSPADCTSSAEQLTLTCSSRHPCAQREVSRAEQRREQHARCPAAIQRGEQANLRAPELAGRHNEALRPSHLAAEVTSGRGRRPRQPRKRGAGR